MVGVMLEARKARNDALLVAHQFRDMAETLQAQKRDMKYEMEKTVEVVKEFWCNKVIEGGSRAGRMLRASLLKQ